MKYIMLKSVKVRTFLIIFLISIPLVSCSQDKPEYDSFTEESYVQAESFFPEPQYTEIVQKEDSIIIVRTSYPYTKFKIIDKTEDVDRIIDYFDRMEKEQLEGFNKIKGWSIGVFIKKDGHYTITFAGNDLLHYDREWFRIDGGEKDKFMDLYNELDYEEMENYYKYIKKTD